MIWQSETAVDWQEIKQIMNDYLWISDGVSASTSETKTEIWPSETKTETRTSEIKTTPPETETLGIVNIYTQYYATGIISDQGVKQGNQLLPDEGNTLFKGMTILLSKQKLL